MFLGRFLTITIGIMQMESRARSALKTITWRVIATLITAGISWLITGRLRFAVLIGGTDAILKVGAYYLHERLWNSVEFGRPKGPDYQI